MTMAMAQALVVDLDANTVTCGQPLVRLPDRERGKLLAHLKEHVSGAVLPPGRSVPSIFVAFPGGRCPDRAYREARAGSAFPAHSALT